MTFSTTTDILIVGVGASGIPTAIGAARTGMKVVLLEAENTRSDTN